MPIWAELVFLLLAFYAIGLGIGWLVWGRGDFGASTKPVESERND